MLRFAKAQATGAYSPQNGTCTCPPRWKPTDHVKDAIRIFRISRTNVLHFLYRVHSAVIRAWTIGWATVRRTRGCDTTRQGQCVCSIALTVPDVVWSTRCTLISSCELGTVSSAAAETWLFLTMLAVRYIGQKQTTRSMYCSELCLLIVCIFCNARLGWPPLRKAECVRGRNRGLRAVQVCEAGGVRFVLPFGSLHALLWVVWGFVCLGVGFSVLGRCVFRAMAYFGALSLHVHARLPRLAWSVVTPLWSSTRLHFASCSH